MAKYYFSTMPEECLRSLCHNTTRLLALFSGHYQSMVFNTGSDIYYVGVMVEKLREILAEANEELSKRKPPIESPISDFSF